MQYKALRASFREIRLLRLLPQSDRGIEGENTEDVLRCTLDVLPLQDIQPEYLTFSLNSQLLNKDIFDRDTQQNCEEFTRENEELCSNFEGGCQSQLASLTPNESTYRFKWGDYSALSYRWGDPSVTKSIEVDGYEIHVTTNLYNALSMFRSQGIFGCNYRLWVDAICINQEDHVERGEQVAFMREIYERAWKVITWLSRDRQHQHKGGNSIFDSEVDHVDKGLNLFKELARYSDDVVRLQIILEEKADFFGAGW